MFLGSRAEAAFTRVMSKIPPREFQHLPCHMLQIVAFPINLSCQKLMSFSPKSCKNRIHGAFLSDNLSISAWEAIFAN
jgi:hypothetical protein